MQDILSVREVAKMVGVTTRTIQRWCKAGLVPGVILLSQQYAIPKSALPVIKELASKRQ
jgi:excisionase family DNA binding protein